MAVSVAGLLSEFGNYMDTTHLYDCYNYSVVRLISALIVANTHVDDWCGTPLYETILTVYTPSLAMTAVLDTDSVVLGFIYSTACLEGQGLNGNGGSTPTPTILTLKFIQELMRESLLTPGTGDSQFNKLIEVGGMQWLNNTPTGNDSQVLPVSSSYSPLELPVLLYKATISLEMNELSGKVVDTK